MKSKNNKIKTPIKNTYTKTKPDKLSPATTLSLNTVKERSKKLSKLYKPATIVSKFYPLYLALKKKEINKTNIDNEEKFKKVINQRPIINETNYKSEEIQKLIKATSYKKKEKLYNKFLDNVRSNLILTIHFPEDILKQLLEADYYLNKYEIYKKETQQDAFKIINKFKKLADKVKSMNRYELSFRTTLYKFSKKLGIEKYITMYIFLPNYLMKKFKKIFPQKQFDMLYSYLRLMTENILFDISLFNNDIYERPKYGCVNVEKNINGCAPQYGSLWMKLYNNKDIINKITLTSANSLFSSTIQKEINKLPNYKEDKSNIGTIKYIDSVIFNMNPITLAKMIDAYLIDNRKTYINDKRKLNKYLEFQYHGIFDIKKNVAEIYYPKSKDKKLSEDITKFCKKFNCKSFAY